MEYSTIDTFIPLHLRGGARQLGNNDGNQTSSHQSFWAYLSSQPVLLIIFVGLLLVVVFYFVGWMQTRRNTADQVAPDTSTNESDDEKKRRLQKQRAQREEWYEKYLEPFTLTIQADHFLTEPTVPSPENTGTTTTPTSSVSLSNAELGVCTRQMCLVLPDQSSLVVDTQCSVCMLDYEPGDRVVRSTLGQCEHVYHYECVMDWLIRGKKRCPMCRQWFVPSTPIAEQMKTLRAMEQSTR